MARNPQAKTQLSPEEEKLGLLLASIASANNELEAVGKTNKRVLAEIEEHKKSLVELQTAKDSLQGEIVGIQRQREQHSKDLDTAKDSLVDINVRKNELGAEFDYFRTSIESKKNELQSEIKSLQEKTEGLKKEFAYHSQTSQAGKSQLEKEIAELNNLLATLSRNETDQKEKNVVLSEEYARLSNMKDLCNRDIEKNNNEILKQHESLGLLGAQKSDIESQIKDGKLEIQKLDEAIIAKKSEYKMQETKLFSIKNRESSLDQRESFIRSQYERAGVKWEE